MSAILIVDDHPLYRAGVAAALRSLLGPVRVVEAGSADEALALLASGEGVTLALIDARLPGKDGFATVREIRARHPAIASLLISGVEGPEAAERARQAGARGYFPKSLGVAELVEAIRRVESGGESFPDRAPAAARPTAQASGVPFSLRQLEVLAYIGRGYSNKRIARALGIAERTVKWHVSEILAGPGVENRTQALIEAARRGLIASS